MSDPNKWEAWQERGPHGAWFVKTSDGGHLFVGHAADGTPDEALAKSIADTMNGRAALKAQLAEATARAEKAEAENKQLREALIKVDEWSIDWAEGLDSNVEKIKSAVRDALEDPND